MVGIKSKVVRNIVWVLWEAREWRMFTQCESCVGRELGHTVRILCDKRSSHGVNLV